ncbi:ABC-2 type transport system ATP-binding protein [Evansella vedderi]|uniref:ABC-2 type transport system ATP-binding protein n=1 Tax=Evansella vedderi TaxID=38282 RepID=A0ABT9ZP79_9BACI|nr:ABC transporter ATP-binding protein [Evansella vedderi]MDQ0253041.1 ABC-2 type transport system ATP-binding protein [Evansella vedderi]
MIETVNLTKKYGSFTAVEDLNLSISEGTVYGVVGQNGAGKSTTFQILATLMSPTYGSAYISGFDITKEPAKVRQVIGYMPDFFGVYDQFKAEEYLHFYGASYGLSVAEREEVIPQLLELVNLTGKRDSYVDLLSRGMKQRLCLARALIHNPKVLILDEPASGLDPRARVEMREILKELKAMGKTIIISSHILPELAEMCDEIGVINCGQLVATGTVSEIQTKLQVHKEIIVTVSGEMERAVRFFEGELEVLNVSVVENGVGKIQFGFRGSDSSQQALIKKAVLADIPLLGFQTLEKNLEDVFMEIMKEVEVEGE